MSKTKAGRPRTKIWDEFEDDPVLAMKRYCRCKWCGADVKADAARMYNHVTDRCTRIDEAKRQTHQVRLQENDGGGDAVGDMDDEAKDLTNDVASSSNTGAHRAVGAAKAKGGRPKDPIWNEFRTNDDLRVRRYCICVWCEKEVKGDTTRMTAHVVERCTAVDAVTKAKYTVKHRKLDDSRDHNSVPLATNLPAAPVAPPTSAPTSLIPLAAQHVAPPSPPPAAIVDVATLVASPPPPPNAPLQHPEYSMLPAESPPSFAVSQFGFLKELGLHGENRGVYGGGDWFGHGEVVAAVNPSTNEVIASIQCGTRDDYMHVVRAMDVAAISWRQASMVLRSAVVHQIGAAFRSHQRGLAHLVAMELGVVLGEAMRHVDQMIPSCDAAATAVRSIPGSTVQAPADHAGNVGTAKELLVERHVPLAGHVGLLTPFHAPMWTGAMALACGNAVLWKPSLMLTAIAITRLMTTVLTLGPFHETCCLEMANELQSGPVVGACLVQDKRMAVVCFKGSADQGHRVNVVVAERMGQCVLDLDTQNAIVVNSDANVDHAVRIVVNAMGT